MYLVMQNNNERGLYMLNESTIVHPVKDLDVTDLSGEKVMIDFSTGKYYLLKGSANDIWDMLADNITVKVIKEKLMEIYDVDEETCLSSISDFLLSIEKNGFITLENS